MKNKLLKTFGASALVFAMTTPYALADGIDTVQLDRNCAVTSQKQISHAEAASCVVPFYQAAEQQATALKAKIDKAALSENDRLAINFYASAMCTFESDEARFKANTSPEEYLRKPQFCLSALTDTADKYGVSYNRDEAAFLISRLKLHRRLDVN